ncbi:MAG TPA: hypothetical protein VI757_08880 [Bacteroidia bacterium]|nr:hypothetical protein [Bacteroidia bacterium]
MDATTKLPETAKEIPPLQRWDYEILASELRKRRGITRRINNAQRQQIDILIYLYKHPALSAVQLRSMFRLIKITSYRQTGALRKAGLIKWKGSHHRGAYVITDEGKKFIEDTLLNRAPVVHM